MKRSIRISILVALFALVLSCQQATEFPPNREIIVRVQEDFPALSEDGTHHIENGVIYSIEMPELKLLGPLGFNEVKTISYITGNNNVVSYNSKRPMFQGKLEGVFVMDDCVVVSTVETDSIFGMEGTNDPASNILSLNNVTFAGYTNYGDIKFLGGFNEHVLYMYPNDSTVFINRAVISNHK